MSVPGDLSSAQADRNEYAFTLTLINPGPTGHIVNEPAVSLCRIDPGPALLIGPLHDLAAVVHAALKLLQ
ncbi:MAG TPA: hypothetical protein VHZ55_23195 [Bryobacteraceae bacterium]|jgi:hypothetical protein|nr:hypothetical protein [Bryobacteraceae bacterium]